MATQQLNIRISEEEAAHLEALALQTAGILTKQAVARLLIQHSIATGWHPLTSDPTTQTMGEPAARRASSSNSSSKSSKNKSICAIPTNLEPHTDLIRDFWRIKKGSKGEVAWKLLMGELEKIRAKHGSTVVVEQLQLAINGKWQGIQLKNYEQFLPKGTTAAQAELKHPAYKVFTAERGFDDGPTTNPMLEDLF
jgi:hypothetical protein